MTSIRSNGMYPCYLTIRLNGFFSLKNTDSSSFCCLIKQHSICTRQRLYLLINDWVRHKSDKSPYKKAMAAILHKMRTTTIKNMLSYDLQDYTLGKSQEVALYHDQRKSQVSAAGCNTKCENYSSNQILKTLPRHSH